MADNFFDQASYLRLLNMIQQATYANADDSNSIDGNTMIQYFDAPYDDITFATQLLSWLTTSNQRISQSDNDKLTFAASVTPTLTDVSTIVWDDGTGLSNWEWGANGEWG